MTNYTLDEEERSKRAKEFIEYDDQEDINRIVGKSSKATQQWDAQTQSYMSVKEDEEEDEYVPMDTFLESQKQRQQRVGYENEEVTKPKHYDKVGFAIQPIEYITKNELDFLEGNVIKYVSRYQHKGGVNDLLKARTYIEFLIERERGKNGG